MGNRNPRTATLRTVTTPLIGREDVSDPARSILEPDGPRLVVLNGPSGVGKTRILETVAESATMHDLIRLYASSAMRHIPFGVLGPVLPLQELPTDPTLLISTIHRSLIGAAAKPVLLTVDDAHELDRATVGVVHQLVSHGSARVLATVRNPPGLPSPLAELAQADRSLSLDVPALDRDQSDRLLGSLLGVPASRELAQDVWRRTLGVPLYIKVLVRDALDRGVIGVTSRQADAQGDLPSDSLHHLVRARLAQVPGPVRRAIEAVAIAGPLPHDVLVDVAGARPVSQGVHLGLLHRRDAMIDLSHPVYTEALVEQIPHSARATIAATVADSWSALPGRPDPIREAVLADLAGRDPGAAACTRAATEAVTRLDGQLGERFARAALHSDPTSFDAALALGRSLMIRGNAAEADRVLRNTTPDDASQRIARALARAHVQGFLQGDSRSAMAILAREAEAVGQTQRSSLDADRSLYAAMEGSFHEAVDAGMMVLANPDADGVSQVRASINVALAKVMLGRFDDVEDDVERSSALAEDHRHEAPFALLQTDLIRINERLLRGRAHDIEAWRARWEHGGQREVPPEWLEWLGLVKAYRGDLEESVSLLRQSLLGFERADPFHMHPQAIGVLAMTQGQMGSMPDGLDELLTQAEAASGRDARLRTWIGRGRGWQAATTGDLPAAAQLAASTGEAAVQQDHVTWGGMALHDAVRFGRSDLVVDRLAELSASTTSVALLDEFARHAAAMCTGDVGELDDVAATFLRFGLVPLAIEVWCQIGQLEQRSGRSARAARSSAKADMLLRRVPELRTPAVIERPDGLTPRELGVALLALGELKSREIASRLFVSKRTVDNHLFAIYRKLDVHGREGLAAEFSDLEVQREQPLSME